MANFAVSLKKLTERVSVEVVYTPKDLDKIRVEERRSQPSGPFFDRLL